MRDWTDREARKASREEICEIVVRHTLDLTSDKAIYPSDIAYEYSLDPDEAEAIMDELLEEGFIK